MSSQDKIIKPMDMPKGLLLPDGSFHSIEDKVVATDTRFKFTPDSIKLLTIIFVSCNKRYSEALFQCYIASKNGSPLLPKFNNITNTLSVLDMLEQISLMSSHHYKPEKDSSPVAQFTQLVRDSVKEAKELKKLMKQHVKEEAEKMMEEKK